jgi:hypothetical protein
MMGLRQWVVRFLSENGRVAQKQQSGRTRWILGLYHAYLITGVEATQDQNIFCSVTSVASCLQHTFYCSKCLLTSQWWCSLGEIEDFFEQALLFIEQVPNCNETLVDETTPACSIFWWILFCHWMSFTLNCRYSGASYLYTGYMV